MRIRVAGRTPLHGIYRPSGSSNAAQALIAAALLSDSPVKVHNVPHTLSTTSMISAAESIGAGIAWQDDGCLSVEGSQLARRVLSHTETDASIGILLLVAPMLIRRQHVRLEVDFPLNRIRTHLEALRDLGIDVLIAGSAVEFKAMRWERKDIILTQASVTATALVLMLAARLGKETIIHNAACEPHVQELARMLVGMGVAISGIGSNVLTVSGVNELRPTTVTIAPDYIEAASTAAISALCGGRVQIDGVQQADMRVIAKIFWRLGIQVDIDDGTLYIPKHDAALTVSNREEDVDSSIETAPWPGFPSDLVSVATVIATQVRGTSLIHEKMFANRLLFVDKLKAMGAQIVLCDPHRAIVVGPTPLHGIYMDTPDVRAGIGLLAAALVADGESVIDNAQVLDHTFSGVIAKLQVLNARITVEG